MLDWLQFVLAPQGGAAEMALQELEELVGHLSARRGKEARKVAVRHVMNAGKVAIGILRTRIAEEAAAAAS